MSRTISAAGGLWSDNATWIEGSPPSSSDEVLSLGTSGPLVIDVDAVCRIFDLDSYNETLTHNDGVSLSIGDSVASISGVALRFSPSMTYNPLGSMTCPINFVSTAVSQQTMYFAGHDTSDLEFDGLGSSYLFLSDHSHLDGAQVRLKQGILDTNDFYMSWGFFKTNYSTARTLTMGSSTFDMSFGPIARAGASINSFFYSSTTGLTVTLNSALVRSFKRAETNAPLWQTGTIDWNGLSLEFHGGGIATISGGTCTFKSLIVNGDLFNGVEDRLQVNSNYTVTSALEFNGASAGKRLRVHSNGGPRTIGVTGIAVVAQYADFSGMSFTEIKDFSAIPGGSGDLGSNTNIIFTTGGDIYWKSVAAGTYDWADPARWFSSSNGVSPLNRGPLAQDTVFFDSNSIGAVGTNINTTVGNLGMGVDWTGVTNSPNWNLTTTSTINGGLSLETGMTITTSASDIWLWIRGNGSGGSFVLDTKSVFLPFELLVLWMIDSSNTLEVPSDLYLDKTMYVRNTTLNVGTSYMDLGSCYFRSSSVVNMGTGIWNIRDDNEIFGGPSFYAREGIVNADSSTIRFSNDTSSTQEFYANGRTFNNVEIAGSGNSTLLISGSSTFNKVSSLKSIAHTVQFVAGTTNAITNLNLVGSLGNEITLESSTAATFTLTNPSGVLINEYLILENAVATGGATWGAMNSTDVGGNSGWQFVRRELFHKGGFVSDAATWSLIDGGVGGEPIPTALDNVTFGTGVVVDSDFDIPFSVSDFICTNTRWTKGNNPITVYGDFSIVNGSYWRFNTSLLTLYGDVAIGSNFTCTVPVLFKGRDCSIDIDNTNKFTNKSIVIDKDEGAVITCLSDIYFNKSSSQDLTLEEGILNLGVYNFTLGDLFTQNGGSVIGTTGLFLAQRYSLNSVAAFDPYRAKSTSNQNTVLFSDGPDVSLMPSGGDFEFTGSNHWSITQDNTEFPHLIFNKCPTCNQGGFFRANKITLLNNSKFGSGSISGDLFGSGYAGGNTVSWIGSADQATYGNFRVTTFKIDKPIGILTIHDDFELHQMDAIDGASRIDFTDTEAHLKAANAHSGTWITGGAKFWDFRFTIAPTGGGNLTTTIVENDCYIDQTLHLIGNITVGRNLVLTDLTIVNQATFNLNGSGIQLLDIILGSNVGATFNIENTGEVKLAHAIDTTGSAGGIYVKSGGLLNLDGFDLSIANSLNIESGGKLKVKGNEAVTIDGLPSRGHADFVIDAGASIEYFDSSVIARVDTLADSFQNLIFGANKVHEFASGIANEIEILGDVSSSGVLGSQAVLQTIGGASSDWYMKLSGTSSIADGVIVEHSNASSGLPINSLYSIDGGNNTNWFNLLGLFAWIGGTGVWNLGSNWSGGSVPGSGDIATFDGNTPDDCDMNTAINIKGINIAPLYNGSISQNSNEITVGSESWIQDGGAFIGGDAPISLSSLFSLTGGLFDSTSDIFKATRSFSIDGGAFGHNNGTVEFGHETNQSITTGGSIFNNMNFFKRAGGTSVVTLNDSFRVLGKILMGKTDQSFFQVHASTPIVLTLEGSFEINSFNQYTTTFGNANLTLLVSGSGIHEFTMGTIGIPAVNATFHFDSTGTMKLLSDFDLEGSTTFGAGALDQNGFTMIISSNIGTTNFSPNGRVFSDLKFSKRLGDQSTIMIVDDFSVSGSLLVDKTDASSFSILPSGTRVIALAGDAEFKNTSDALLLTFGNGDLTLLINGANTQTIYSTKKMKLRANVKIDSTGILKLLNNFYVNGNFQYVSGDMDQDGFDVIMDPTTSNSIAANGFSFQNLSLLKSDGNASITQLLDDFTVKGRFLIDDEDPSTFIIIPSGVRTIHVEGDFILARTSGESRFGSSDLTLRMSGNSPQSISYTGGLLKSNIKIESLNTVSLLTDVLIGSYNINIATGALHTNGFSIDCDVLAISDRIIMRGNEISANSISINPTTSTVELYDTNSFTLSSLATEFNNIVLAPGKIHNFTSGTVHTINGTISSNSSLANPAILRSTIDSVKWKLNLRGSSVLFDTIDVKDCDSRYGKWLEAVGSVYTGSNFRCIEKPIRSLMI